VARPAGKRAARAVASFRHGPVSRSGPATSVPGWASGGMGGAAILARRLLDGVARAGRRSGTTAGAVAGGDVVAGSALGGASQNSRRRGKDARFAPKVFPPRRVARRRRTVAAGRSRGGGGGESPGDFRPGRYKLRHFAERRLAFWREQDG